MQDAGDDQTPSLSAEILDVVRRALCALSGSPDPSFPRPVHIHRISHLLRLIVARDDVGIALDRMEILTESVRLARGYWLPAPVRCVDAYGVLLILSPLCTSDLQKTIDVPVNMAGLGRVAEANPVAVPRQDYWSWVSAPKDIRHWTSITLEALRGRLTATSVDIASIDVHAFSRESRRISSGDVGRWTRLSELRGFSGEALCRARLGQRGYRYLFALISCGVVTHEAEIRTEQRARLRYGLDILAGGRHRIKVDAGGDVLRFELYRPLPIEEQRLVNALCYVGARDGRAIVKLKRKYVAPIRESMSAIGIDLELQE